MTEPKVLLYIDNSNMFVNAQVFSAVKKKFPKGVKDTTCRLGIGKLLERARYKRQLLHGKLYGSEPPVLDSVWKAIREKKIEVFTSQRSTWNSREKQTDTKFVAAAIEDLIIYKAQTDDNRIVILLTGDEDMMPVVQTALKYKWNVEIWSYEFSLWKGFREEAEKNTNVKLVYMDEFFHEITFSEFIWGGFIPRERSFVIRYGKPINYTDRKSTLIESVKIASTQFKLPFRGKYAEDFSDLILVPCCPEVYKNKLGEIEQNYNFNSLIWSHIDYFKELVKAQTIVTFVNYLQEKEGLEFDINTIEVEGHEDNVDIFDSSVAEGEFITIGPKKKVNNLLYSDLCPDSYWCRFGKKCKYTHRESEKELFKAHPHSNYILYKSKICRYTSRCKFAKEGKLYLCPFVHSDIEVRCLHCKKIGIHYTDECEIN